MPFPGRRWWWGAVVAGYALMTYNLFSAWWASLAGTALILWFARLARPGDWIERTGLRVPAHAAAFAIVLCAGCAALALVLIDRATAAAGVGFSAFSEFEGWHLRALATAGQTLNEEIVLGALLLWMVSTRWKGALPITIAVAVAALFAVFHLGFYALRPESVVNQGLVGLPALLSLFAIGVLRNDLILGTGHVGYAWGIHFGWNLVFFNSGYARADGSGALDEPEMFNSVLGDPLTLTVIVAAAISRLLWQRRRRLSPGDSGPWRSSRTAR